MGKLFRFKHLRRRDIRNKIELAFPKSWIELSSEQICSIAGVLMQNRSKIDFLTRCFIILTGVTLTKTVTEDPDEVTWFYFKKDGIRFRLSSDFILEAMKPISWLTENISLCHCPKIGNYHSPDYRLFGVTVEEYLTADNFYVAYSRTKELQWLDRLITVLFRKPSESYDGDKLSEWKKRFNKTDLSTKYGVYLWFTSVKSWLRDKYPDLYSGDQSEPCSPDETVLNLLASLNNGDVTANEMIMKSHIHEAFHLLNLKIQESHV